MSSSFKLSMFNVLSVVSVVFVFLYFQASSFQYYLSKLTLKLSHKTVMKNGLVYIIDFYEQ
jgi:hypothetical protein